MRSIVYIQLAFAAVASGLGTFDHTRQRAKHEFNHKAVQEHSRFIRSENDDIEQSGLEVNPTGKMRLKKSIGATHEKTSEIHLAPESANMAEIHHTAGDATQTTTLSAIHLMASTTAKGLVPPPERKFGTTTIAMGSTSQQPVNPLDGFPTKDLPASLVSEEDSEWQPVNNGSNTTNTSNNTDLAAVPSSEFATDPISYRKEQVTNAEAAFEVTGCSSPLDHFNGIYMPSNQVNTNQACTSLVWSMSNSYGIHVLYHVRGTWCLDLTGNDPAFNGRDDNGRCAPESRETSWSIIDKDVNGGGAPTINRKAAQAYTTTTTVVWSNAIGDPEPYYYVVTGAGIPGFNGVYWMTPIVVADVRCQRMFSKGGPDNTEYTLGFGNSNGNEIWYLQSLIGGQTLRPYAGTDDGSCSPETVTLFTVDTGTGAAGGTAPNIVRSLTYSTTTTTTTTAETTTTTTMASAQSAAGALRIGVAGNLSNQNKQNVTNTTPTEKTGAHRNFSMLALRLLVALAVAHALS